MQPRTPPRQVTGCVNDRGEFAVPGGHSHHAKQFDGQLSLPAPDTRSHGSRRLTLDHGSV
ncbi:hypothetical protein MAHJHV65_42710 [Mycobacterium avium subsp. hominissuis]